MVAFITSEYEHLQGFTETILFISQICPALRKEIIENDSRKCKSLGEGHPHVLGVIHHVTNLRRTDYVPSTIPGDEEFSSEQH